MSISFRAKLAVSTVGVWGKKPFESQASVLHCGHPGKAGLTGICMILLKALRRSHKDTKLIRKVLVVEKKTLLDF